MGIVNVRPVARQNIMTAYNDTGVLPELIVKRTEKGVQGEGPGILFYAYVYAPYTLLTY